MPRPPVRRLASALLLGLVLVPGAARASEHQVYLSWGSPYGMPGARDTLVRACGDSTRVDTLCLSFEPDQDLSNLVGISGEVEFLPPARDTLAGYWSFQSESRGPGGCWGEFADSGREGCPFPWSTAGMPAVRFQRRDGAGVVRFMYVVSALTPTSVRAGERYCLARILLHHRADGGSGCRQPLRVVWSDSDFGLYPGGVRRVLSGRARPVFIRTP